ncbi:hypothetical protein VB773_01875 [Haloarculaceae archaeon H-GB2-1]|nr:hypothetical protein [Haloarculaceae archaeon H-GB1-1]MEA5388414.1 hypothetical protein [Haloarculaceae archaeon H-GB11]MEA5406451.1 hypothetical protein [Haloarculaceae archaeon H-GB2-1]
MISVESSWTRTDGVTFVTARIVNDAATARRVTVANELDGPVWPPRSQGVPESGWSETGFEGRVEPGTHPIGYATPAEPATPPVRLVDVEPVGDGGERIDDDGRYETPRAVVRECGDPAPPRDAIPDDGPATEQPPKTGGVASTEDAPESRHEDRERDESDDGQRSGSDTEREAAQTAPNTVPAWLDECERRIERAEALGGVQTVPEATEAVAAVGGLEGVREVARAVDADGRGLAHLAQRLDDLAERADAVDVPVATLERLR